VLKELGYLFGVYWYLFGVYVTETYINVAHS